MSTRVEDAHAYPRRWAAATISGGNMRSAVAFSTRERQTEPTAICAPTRLGVGSTVGSGFKAAAAVEEAAAEEAAAEAEAAEAEAAVASAVGASAKEEVSPMATEIPVESCCCA